MAFDRERMQARAAEFARCGIYLGSSSWKYEEWLGQLYTPSRYEYRGKVARKRFESDCLREYAEVFKTVCVDAAYYTFPSQQQLERMADQVPSDFRFGLKVTDTITVKTFPDLNRFHGMAGKANENYLNADLFEKQFLRPCESARLKVGLLMFEFSRFWWADYSDGREFVADLDKFLGHLPIGWPYGVEMRNQSWLGPEYFDCLQRYRVAHVFNSWQAMPPVSEQMALPGSCPNPGLVAARFLLTPGRKHEEAVRLFQPYTSTKEINEEARKAGANLISESAKAAGRRTFIYVNSRLEGNALNTLDAMVARACS